MACDKTNLKELRQTGSGQDNLQTGPTNGVEGNTKGAKRGWPNGSKRVVQTGVQTGCVQTGSGQNLKRGQIYFLFASQHSSILFPGEINLKDL